VRITAIKTWLMQVGADGRRPAARNIAKEQKGPSRRNWVFVKLYTDEGLTGIGECSGWPSAIRTILHDLEPVLIGEDPQHIERLWHKVKLAAMGHGFVGTPLGGALAGIDMALWDIKGKALGQPVWSLLGGKVRERVPAYAHADHPERAADLAERGFRLLKASSNNQGVVDVARLFAIREAVGPDVDLCLDAKGAPWMTLPDAIALGRKLEPLRLAFYEEALPPEAVLDYAKLRAAVSIPIATGERYGMLGEFRTLFAIGGVDVIQPDTGRAGGITQMRKMAALAEAFGAMIAPHSGSLGPVAEFAAVHLMAATPNCLAIERVEDDWPGREEVITNACRAEGGSFRVPDAPGLGVDIVEREVERYPTELNVDLPRPGDADVQAAGAADFLWQGLLKRRAGYLDPRS
jgi:galactonate dehydratase